jgi:hypothetical protein
MKPRGEETRRPKGETRKKAEGRIPKAPCLREPGVVWL